MTDIDRIVALARDMAAEAERLTRRSAEVAEVIVADEDFDGGVNALLSPREKQVMALFALGFGTKEIAARLGIAIKTVDSHKGRASGKIGARARHEIVAHAIQSGWIKLRAA